MWSRRDWHEFFEIARTRWQTRRPPRPVDMSVRNLALPAAGYSVAELSEAGLSLEQAELFGLPVDMGRVGSLGLNVTALRDFVRSTRDRS